MGLLYNKKAKHIYKHIFNRFFNVFAVKTNLFLHLPDQLGQEHEHELDCLSWHPFTVITTFIILTII